MKAPSKYQPAIKNYFFEKGFKDLKTTINTSWTYNLQSAQEKFEESNVVSISDAIDAEEYSELITNIFLKGAALAIFVFGTIWFGALSILHFIILGIIMLFFFTGFSLVKGIEFIYKAYYKIFSACPDCYAKFNLPLYNCPNCGSEHDNLQPNEYGVLHRVCMCGHKLPSSVLTGRASLNTSKCRKCNNLLTSSEINIPIAIPIIGATDAGKSSFLYSSLIRLFENNKDNLEINFQDKESESLYNTNETIIKRGEFPLKTTELQPRAILLNIKPIGTQLTRTVYYFDAAGESFLSKTDIRFQKYHEYIRGLIWIVDPLDLTNNVSDLFTRFHNSIENYFSETSSRNIPLAIVFTKRDLKTNPKFHGNIGNDANDDIKHFLRENHEAFLGQVITKFKTYKFFYVSSNGKKLIDTGLPFKWLISKMDNKFKI